MVDNNITTVAIDNHGNKWFGAGISYSNEIGGISKFDGNNWTTYNPNNSGIPTGNVSSIISDPHGDIWMAGGGGITKFNGTSWTNYNTGNSAIPTNSISLISIDNFGNIWGMQGAYGLAVAKFDGTSWSNFTVVNNTGSGLGSVSDMAFDHLNNLWITYQWNGPGTTGGVAKFDGSNWTIFTNSLVIYSPNSVAVDANNNKWFASGSGLVEFNDTTWTSFPGSPSNRWISVDHLGNKWYDADWTGNTSSGLGRFDGSNWSLYNPSQSGIPDNDIAAFAIDHHGNSWVSSTYPVTGLAKFDGENWTVFTSVYPEGWENEVSCITVDKSNRVWFGGGFSGVYLFDGSNEIDFSDNSNPDGANSICADTANSIWIGTSTGVLALTNGFWTIYDTSNSGVAYDYMNPMATDAHNNKWFCAGDVVSKFDGVNWTIYDSSNSGLPNSEIGAVAIDHLNNIWFATGAGLIKFDGINWTKYDTSNSGIPNNIVYSIAFDKFDNIWCSTYNSLGATKFDGTAWTNYNCLNSGLGSNEVFNIVIDNLDNKWFITPSGLSELLSSDSVFSVQLQFYGEPCTIDSIMLNPVVNHGKPPYTFLWQAVGSNLSCNNCQYPTTNVSQNSIFIVTVTDSNDLSASDTLRIYSCRGETGIKSITDINSFKIFPNPTTDEATIRLTVTDENDVSITVQNIEGQQMQTERSLGWLQQGEHNFTINTANLTNGFYLIGCKTGNGISYQKLIVQR